MFQNLKSFVFGELQSFLRSLEYEVENEKLTTTLKCSVMGVAPLSAYSRGCPHPLSVGGPPVGSNSSAWHHLTRYGCGFIFLLPRPFSWYFLFHNEAIFLCFTLLLSHMLKVTRTYMSSQPALCRSKFLGFAANRQLNGFLQVSGDTTTTWVQNTKLF